MIKKIIQNYWEVFTIFLLSLTPLLWLRHGEVILGHDSGYRLDPFGYLQTLWYSWDHSSGFGVDVTGSKGFLIAQLPEALLVRLTHSLSLGQTLSFVFWFFIIGISMYVCVRAFFPDRKYWIMRLLSSVGYMYNLFLLQGWFITERAKFSLFAALPLVFVICWSTLRGTYSILKGSLLFGFTLFLLNGGGSPPLFGGILITVGVLVLVDIAEGISRRQGLARAWRVVRMVFSMTCFTVLFNAYWVVPQLYQAYRQYGTRLLSAGGFGGILAWESYVSVLASFSNLFRLQGIPDWYNNRLHQYTAFYNQPILILLSFLPMLSFTYVLVRRDWWVEFKQKYHLLGTMVAIWFVGLIFTAGSHSFAGFIYTAFMRYVPGFAIFRTSFYKFGPALWFSAIVLFSLSATVILIQLVRSKILYGLTGIILLLGLLLYHYPYFFTNFFLWSAPFTTKVQIPNYVTDISSYINTTYGKEKPRILLLPPIDTSFHTDSYEWGFWGLDLFTRLSLSSPTVANDIDLPIVRAMYNAIYDDNMKLFTTLAKQAGITKLLWRGDVLYSDKATTSNDFSSMKKAVDASSEVKEEKQYGKWTLYTLPGVKDVQQVQAASVFVQADVPEEHKASLFALGDTRGLPILFTGNVPATDMQPMIARSVISAACVYCDPSQLKQIEKSKTLSTANFLPDSPLYGLSKFREDWVLNSYRSIPEQYIDANLGYATNHLGEVWSAVMKKADNTGSLAEQSFDNFQHRIEDAVRTLSVLPEIQQNTYRLRLVSFLHFYENYLADLAKENTTKGLLSERFFGNAYQYLQKQLATVSSGVWVSEGAVKRYYLSISTDGTYKLPTPGTQKLNDAVSMDGKQIKLKDLAYLTTGTHKFETVPGGLVNADITNTSTASGDIRMSYGDSYTVKIHHISDRKLYSFRLEYQVSMGENIFVKLQQNNDVSDQYGNQQSALILQLRADGKRHVIEEIVHPNQAVSSANISFFSANVLGQLSMVSVKDVSFTDIQSEDIFALRNFVLPTAPTPTVSSKQINPGVYQVHVAEAVSPYVLIFNEQFGDDWRIYRRAPGQPIWNMAEMKAPHFAVNGYANAWYLSEQGSYDIVILYFPQILFVLSVGISIMTLSVSIVWFFWSFRKEKI